VVAQLGAMAHMVFASHVACAEHGDLMHVAAPSRTASADAEPSKTAGIDAATPDDADHEHCSVAAHRSRETWLAGSHATSIEPSAPAPSAFVVVPRTAYVTPAIAAPIPLILLAPKSSPPV